MKDKYGPMFQRICKKMIYSFTHMNNTNINKMLNMIILLAFGNLLLLLYWAMPSPNSHLHPSCHSQYLINIKQKTIINGLLFVVDEYNHYFMVEYCSIKNIDMRKCKPIWDAITINENYSVITSYNTTRCNIKNNGQFIRFDPNDPFINDRKYPSIVYMYMQNNNKTIIDDFYRYKYCNYIMEF